MTIRELRKELKRKLNSLNLLGLDEIADYYTAEWVAFEELYREGTVRNFSNDFLANANHYQRYTREYENLSILQTLDLHSISATKKVARDMMAMFLNVDGWLHGRNRKREKETTAPEAEQTAETVETEITEKVIMRLSDGDGNVLGVKIFVGTYKQADEEAERIMAETGCYVSYVRYTDSRWNWMSREYYCGTDSESALTIVSPITMKIEQTENNAENVSETYGGEDVKADTSKTDELSGTTKMIMVFRPVVSEYLRQRGYIDTS